MFDLNATDYIVITILFYYFFTGWKKGLLRTLLGPLSLGLGLLAAYLYYNETQKLLNALVISIVGPFLIGFVISFILRLVTSVKVDNENYITPGKILGSLVNMAWSGAILLMTLLFITLIPVNFTWFNSIQDNITSSRTYQVIRMATGDELTHANLDIRQAVKVLEDPKKLETLQKTREFQDVMSNPKIINITHDEETMKQVKDNDLIKLLDNPNMQELLKDRDLLKKLFALQQKMIEQGKQ